MLQKIQLSHLYQSFQYDYLIKPCLVGRVIKIQQIVTYQLKSFTNEDFHILFLTKPLICVQYGCKTKLLKKLTHSHLSKLKVA